MKCIGFKLYPHGLECFRQYTDWGRMNLAGASLQRMLNVDVSIHKASSKSVLSTGCLSGHVYSIQWLDTTLGARRLSPWIARLCEETILKHLSKVKSIPQPLTQLIRWSFCKLLWVSQSDMSFSSFRGLLGTVCSIFFRSDRVELSCADCWEMAVWNAHSKSCLTDAMACCV